MNTKTFSGETYVHKEFDPKCPFVYDTPSSVDKVLPSVWKIIRGYLNLMVQYFVHKSLPEASVTSRVNPVHTIPPQFHKIHFIH